MARSMTGYGNAELEKDGWICKVEIRSVNQRFLDIHLRLPSNFNRHERELKERIKYVCKRGKIDCTVKLDPSSACSELTLNVTRIEQVCGLLKQFESLTGHSLQLHWRDLGQLELFENSILKEQPEACLGLVQQCLGQALMGMDEMKKREGQALCDDIHDRLVCCRNWVDDLEKESIGGAETQLAKLQKRVRDLMANIELAPERLNQELALMSDKLDITEELVRLRTHFHHMQDLLKQTELGKKGEFMLQEINRETNTLASKSNNTRISRIVVDFKSEVEKIREQLLNLE